MTSHPLDPQYSAILAQAIVDTVRDPLLVLDCDFNVAAASRSFLREFDVPSKDVIGHSVYAILDGHFNVVGLANLIKQALPDHVASKNFEIDTVFPRIGQRNLIVSVSEVFFAHNVHKAILLSFHDETHRRSIEMEKAALLGETQKLLQEKQVLLLEMQHRIGNSLQVIASILLLKTRATTSEEARQHLEDAYTRVMSVAKMQRHIDIAAGSDTVDLVPYFTTICNSLAGSMIDDQRRISLRYEFDDASASSSEAVSLGLIMTELVINSLKYAFPTNRPNAEILVKYESSGANWRLTVSDNGIGRPQDSTRSSDGLGSTLVKALAQQIRAHIEIVSTARGLSVSVAQTAFTSRSTVVEKDPSRTKPFTSNRTGAPSPATSCNAAAEYPS
jgi:two-component sensor histidine kinase